MRSGCFPGGCEEGLQRGGHLEPSPERNGCRDDKVQMTRAFLDLLISQKSEGSWEHEAARSALKVRGRLGWLPALWSQDSKISHLDTSYHVMIVMNSFPAS